MRYFCISFRQLPVGNGVGLISKRCKTPPEREGLTWFLREHTVFLNFFLDQKETNLKFHEVSIFEK